MSSELVVFDRFTVTRVDGRTVNLRIQEIRPRDFTKLNKYLQKYFLDENPFGVALGLNKCDESWQELYASQCSDDQFIGLICYEDLPDDLELDVVACNAMRAYGKDDKPMAPYKSEMNRKLVQLNTIQREQFDVLSAYRVQRCLTGVALSTHPDYRHCGIALKLLQARLPLIQRHGIPVTDAWFLTVAGQRVAAKAGYETLAELSYDELTRQTGLHFTDVPPTLKLMLLAVPGVKRYDTSE